MLLGDQPPGGLMVHQKWYEAPLAEKLTTWLVFGVIVSLIPFLLTLLFLLGSSKSVKLQDIFGSGELLLVSAVIAAGALGEVALVDVPRSRRLVKVLAIGGCTITILASSSWFGLVLSTIHDKHPYSPATVAVGSLFVFAVALICSTSCIVTSYMRSKSVEESGGVQWQATLVRLIQESEEER
jgi:hypothetical protein